MNTKELENKAEKISKRLEKPITEKELLLELYALVLEIIQYLKKKR